MLAYMPRIRHFAGKPEAKMRNIPDMPKNSPPKVLVVDDEALISALQEGRIFGAGLDVFNNEPALDPRYRSLPNAYIMPHIGSSTAEARRRMGQILIDGLNALMAGKVPTNRLV